MFQYKAELIPICFGNIFLLKFIYHLWGFSYLESTKRSDIHSEKLFDLDFSSWRN